MRNLVLFLFLSASFIFSASALAETDLTCEEVHQIIDEQGSFEFDMVTIATNDVNNCRRRNPIGGRYSRVELQPSYQIAAGEWCFVWICNYIRRDRD